MRNGIAKILGFVVLSLFLCVSSFAQDKIAVIDTNVFYDEKSGIKVLTETIKSTYECDFQSSSFRKKIAELKNEINNLKTQDKSIDEKSLELSKVEEEFNLYRKNRDESYKKRYSLLVEPVIKKIGEKVKEFAKKNGHTIILDVSKSNDWFICELCNDITNEFIKFCNEEFEKEKSQKR
jgi:Skp family chaperone for outer membrane proteins